MLNDIPSNNAVTADAFNLQPLTKKNTRKKITRAVIDDVLLQRSYNNDPRQIAHDLVVGLGTVYSVLRGTHPRMDANQKRYAKTLPQVSHYKKRKPPKMKQEKSLSRAPQAAKPLLFMSSGSSTPIENIPSLSSQQDGTQGVAELKRTVAEMKRVIDVNEMQIEALLHRVTTMENLLLWKDRGRRAMLGAK